MAGKLEFGHSDIAYIFLCPAKSQEDIDTAPLRRVILSGLRTSIATHPGRPFAIATPHGVKLEFLGLRRD